MEGQEVDIQKREPRHNDQETAKMVQQKLRGNDDGKGCERIGFLELPDFFDQRALKVRM